MGESGRARAQEFSWPRVTAKVDDYYGFVIRRLAAQGTLPEHFSAPVPQSPRPGGVGIADEAPGLAGAGAEARSETALVGAFPQGADGED